MNEFESEGQSTPLILECGHSFCEGCIRGILRNFSDDDIQFQKCPVCSHPCVRNGVYEFKKNFSLLEEIENRKNQPNRAVQLDCQCLDRPCSYCSICWEGVCRSCTIHHQGHKMMPYDLESIRLVTKASEMSKKLDGDADMLTRKFLIIDQTKKQVLEDKQAAKKALKDFINGINKSVAQMIQDIEEDIETEFKETLNEINASKVKIQAQFELVMSMETDIELFLDPIQNGTILMTPQTEQFIENSLIAFEKRLVTYLESSLDMFQYTQSHFKFDGEDITHNRVCAAVKDSYMISYKGLKMSLTPTTRKPWPSPDRRSQ